MLSMYLFVHSTTVNPRKLLKFLKKRELKYEKEVKENLEQGIAPPTRRNSVMTGENLLSGQVRKCSG